MQYFYQLQKQQLFLVFTGIKSILMHQVSSIVVNSLCFNMRYCRDIWYTIDGHTQYFIFELPKMTTLHFKKSTVVFKELILT